MTGVTEDPRGAIMEQTVSKSRFKAQALEYFRQVEQHLNSGT